MTQVDAGSTASLTCVAYGEPIVPSITWSKNGGNLNNDSRITTSEAIVSEAGVRFVKSTLEICNTDGSDSDQYTCFASRGTTGDRYVFQLTVNTKKGQYNEGPSVNNYIAELHTPNVVTLCSGICFSSNTLPPRRNASSCCRKYCGFHLCVIWQATFLHLLAEGWQ